MMHLIYVSIICVVISIPLVKSEQSQSKISCSELRDYIPIAESQTDFNQKQVTHAHNYTGEYIYSDVFLKLSQSASKSFLKGDSGKFLNLNPTLREYSKCIRDYLNSVCTPNSAIKCAPPSWYRPVDGICNNHRAAKDGAAGTPYSSISYPLYEDGITEISQSIVTPHELPSPRLLSTTFFGDCKTTTEIYPNGPSQGAVMFGQLIAHDISMGARPAASSTGPRLCCKADASGALPKDEQDEYCAPIISPPDDPIHSQTKRFCFDMKRLKNVYDNDCNLSARKPMNLQTASPDLSIIYGPTKNQSEIARTFISGMLVDNEKQTFFSFDSRASQTPQLAALHSLYIREHNRIAKLTALIRPYWSDEQLYQHTRRYVIAMYHHIIYSEWLPIFLDPKFIKLRFSSCKTDTLASTVEFAHALFRHKHTFVPQTFKLYNSDDQVSTTLSLSDNIGRVDLLDAYDEVVRGYYLQSINFNGCHDEIMNRLFKDDNGNGVDLLAIDIQRARETGVRGYVWYANICLGKNIQTFEDLAPEISKENIVTLERLYKSVVEVDLYVAAKLEEVNQKYKFGPTMSCIVGDQFARYKYCDRYFFDHPLNPQPFGILQLKEIYKSTFARLICDNTNIKRVSRNAFRTARRLVDCDKISKTNVLLL